MIDQEARSERIAIRVFDGRMTEAEATRLTDSELKAAQLPESIARAEALRQKIKLDRAEKNAKKSKKHNYE